MDLICVSLNYWYRGIGRTLFSGPDACAAFPDIYDAMDPGCCVVAEEPRTKRLMASCYFHPRDTHISLGVMNAHPNYFGRGAAGALVRYITNLADEQNRPIRLVSSAMNLDSYSLYTRAGFVPRQLYQDMIVPTDCVAKGFAGVDLSRVRPAVASDLPAIADLEWRVSRIRRPNDLQFFIDNKENAWHVSVHEDSAGKIDGVLASVNYGGSNMLGPGVMTMDDTVAAALIAAELQHHAGRTPLFLVPADREKLIRTIYGWGGRNIELHVVQCRGDFMPFDGISMPTFMPETG
jgi:hypothetical protein